MRMHEKPVFFLLSNNLVSSRKSFTVYYDIILNVKEFLTAFI